MLQCQPITLCTFCFACVVGAGVTMAVKHGHTPHSNMLKFGAVRFWSEKSLGFLGEKTSKTFYTKIQDVFQIK